MADRTDPVRDANDEALAVARTLLSTVQTVALAFLDPDTQAPAIARIGFGVDSAGGAITLLSDLAAHTRALRADPRAALLLGEPGPKGDPLNSPRLSLSATAAFVTDSGDRARLRDVWLASHPKAKLYVDFADFHFVRFTLLSATLNGGFGKAFRIPPQALLGERQ